MTNTNGIFRKTFSILVLSFFLMAYTATNCSKKLADKETPAAIEEEIQLLLNQGRCNEALTKSGEQFPELKAMANLCLGAPSLSCLLSAMDNANRNNSNYLVEATSCASGASGYLLSAINSNRLSDSNEALALTYLAIEEINTAGSGCTDSAAGGCSDLGNFTDEKLNTINELARKGILPDSAIKALKKCNDDYCSTIAEYMATL